MWTYKGVDVFPADPNSSGIRWYARNAPGALGTLKADTKEGMRELINYYGHQGPHPSWNKGSSRAKSGSARHQRYYNAGLVVAAESTRAAADKKARSIQKHNPGVDIRVEDNGPEMASATGHRWVVVARKSGSARLNVKRFYDVNPKTHAARPRRTRSDAIPTVELHKYFRDNPGATVQEAVANWEQGGLQELHKGRQLSYARRKSSPVAYEDRTPLMKLAGISNEDAAKKDLKRRFRQEPLETPKTRQGARFYVTAKSGNRAAYLMGPYSSHMSAQQAEPTAQRLLHEKYPQEGFVAVGTASRPDTVPTLFGRGQSRGKSSTPRSNLVKPSGARRSKSLLRTSDRAARRRGER